MNAKVATEAEKSHRTAQPQYEALIVGAGFGGMGIAIELNKMGIDNILMVEGKEDVGGTWHINHYPGLSVDIDSVTYSYSFEPNPNWSRTFATGAELKDYAVHVADKYNLRRFMQFNTWVEKATYDEAGQFWTIRCQTKGSKTTEITARLLIVATGYLSHPKMPEIKGLNTFKGKMMHTAEWDHDYDLTGKRVAVIGTGATSVQLVPAIAPKVKHLSVFQRTPVWVMPKTDVPIPKAVQRLFKTLPLTQRLSRLASTSMLEVSMVLAVLHYKKFPFLVDMAENISKTLLKQQVKDPVTRAKLTPNYNFGCKRPARTNRYLPAFNRPNVSLITDSIKEINATGIVTQDGQQHDIDMLVLATGFKVWEKGNTPAFEIVGKNGVELGEFWEKQDFQAYEGLTVPGYPNLFNLPSPFSFTGLSYFFTIEAHMKHVHRCLSEMYKRKALSFEVTDKANQDFRAKMMKNMQGTVFVNGNCATSNSYYFNKNGDALFLRPTPTYFVLRQADRFPLNHYHFT